MAHSNFIMNSYAKTTNLLYARFLETLFCKMNRKITYMSHWNNFFLASCVENSFFVSLGEATCTSHFALSLLSIHIHASIQRIIRKIQFFYRNIFPFCASRIVPANPRQRMERRVQYSFYLWTIRVRWSDQKGLSFSRRNTRKDLRNEHSMTLLVSAQRVLSK